MCSNPYYIHSYQPPLKHHYKPKSPPYSIEPEVYLPSFDGNENVEAYLECETKVDQIFEKHRVNEFRRLSMVILSFQEHVMSWWKQRQNDVRIGRKSKKLNWKELKVCMRRKIVFLSYERNKKIREEIKELVKIGKQFIEGKKSLQEERQSLEKKYKLLLTRKKTNNR